MSMIVRFFFQLVVVLALIAGPAQALPMESQQDNHQHSHSVSDHDHHDDGSMALDEPSCCHPVEVAHSCMHQVPGVLVSEPLAKLNLKADLRQMPELRGAFSSRPSSPPHRPPIHLS